MTREAFESYITLLGLRAPKPRGLFQCCNANNDGKCVVDKPIVWFKGNPSEHMVFPVCAHHRQFWDFNLEIIHEGPFV